ncbi:DUF5996 family protein [uncultured Gelidibacter sp.]|uniref:DUF5996 family protein n=1 Tax=uncultured Gelidibacter sp. TaxID=259318 RepID=UPI00262EA952|nr:DUF5996 family protein [uncultured Gelidibacter sp.]
MEHTQWPELSFKSSKDTYETIHLWTQIIGKIKLALNPWINHSWHSTLKVTTNGLTSDPIFSEDKQLEIILNFLEHRLEIISSANEKKTFDLETLKVSSCYKKVLAYLEDIGIAIKINAVPNEIEGAIPFHDNHDGTYDTEAAINFHKAMLKVNQVFTQYRSEFMGKSSDVQFFWGSFDLAISRFSGRKAPQHPGGIPNLPDWVTREAYSHEVMNCGFWPGNESTPFAAFYSYIYPAPDGFKKAAIKPSTAYYDDNLGEFILKYEDVQKSENPSETLLEFLRSSYDHAAKLADWDIEKLQFKLEKK